MVKNNNETIRRTSELTANPQLLQHLTQVDQPEEEETDGLLFYGLFSGKIRFSLQIVEANFVGELSEYKLR